MDVFPDYKKEAEDHLSKAVSKDCTVVISFCLGCIVF